MGRPRKNAFDEATRDRVLAAAEQVFGERGYHAARLEDIAALASIRRPSLLYHFGSKEKLYLSVTQRAFAGIRDAVAGAMLQGDGFEARLEATVDALLELERNHRALLGVVLLSLLEPGAPGQEQVAGELASVIDALEQFIEQQGSACVLGGLPVRAAIVQLVVSHLARSTMGERGALLWGGDNQTQTITRALFLRRAAIEDRHGLS